MIVLQCRLPNCSDHFSVTEKLWWANGCHTVIRGSPKIWCNTVSKLNDGRSFTSLGQLCSAGGDFTDGHSCIWGCVNKRALNTLFLHRYVRVQVSANFKELGRK